MFVMGCAATTAAGRVAAVRLPSQVLTASPGPPSSLSCGDVDPGPGGDERLLMFVRVTSASRDSQRAGLGRAAYDAGRLRRSLDAGIMGNGR